MIRDISEGMSNIVTKYEVEDRGVELEEELTSICIGLGRVGNLTENKADTEFVLSVVGSYLMAKNTGKLPDDAKPPSYIFNENLFPAIDSMEDVIVEEIEEDNDGE